MKEKTKLKLLFKNKKVLIPLALFTLLLTVRMVAQPLLHRGVNKFLANFSPVIEFHVADMDISFLKGGYNFDSVSGKLKSNNDEFIKINEVKVSINWRDFFKGKIKTNIDITGLNFSYTKELKEALVKVPKKKEGKKVISKMFPLDVGMIEVHDSTVILDDYKGLKDKEKVSFTDIKGTVTNLIADSENPYSHLTINAKFLGKTMIETTGVINTLVKPWDWSIDSEMHGFDLTHANQFLKRKVPVTFTKGKLDIYAEAKSEEGKTEGYIKPFFKNIDVIEAEENLKGAKHWFIEVITALGNVILQSPDNKTVATLIPFTTNQSGVHLDKGEVLSKAIEHGFEQKISPGIENRFNLK
ncbi:MAG: DUF748 domain-containing protein [Bacteriovoracaceae bacterium]|nr:DUF748 domain-containing protein [Bacteriovoracaceae bacterium]